MSNELQRLDENILALAGIASPKKDPTSHHKVGGFTPVKEVAETAFKDVRADRTFEHTSDEPFDKNILLKKADENADKLLGNFPLQLDIPDDKIKYIHLLLSKAFLDGFEEGLNR